MKEVDGVKGVQALGSSLMFRTKLPTREWPYCAATDARHEPLAKYIYECGSGSAYRTTTTRLLRSSFGFVSRQTLGKAADSSLLRNTKPLRIATHSLRASWRILLLGHSKIYPKLYQRFQKYYNWLKESYFQRNVHHLMSVLSVFFL